MKKRNFLIACIYIILFFIGTKALFHGFPDIERFFAEWSDERIALTYIMKFGTLNFAPTQIMHPPLYHYLTFIPIGLFYVIGKFIGMFVDKVDFVRFYFNNTHYFFFIGRAMSYIFYWLTAMVIFKIVKLFFSKKTAHLTTLAFLLTPRFISDYSTTRPDTLLMLNCSIFLYFFLKFYLERTRIKSLFLSAFFLGLAIATKYNALFLSFIFTPFLFLEIHPIAKQVDLKRICKLSIGFVLFEFLGFFIADPFFIIKFKTYFYNLFLFDTVWVNQLYKGYYPSLFIATRIRDLISTLYLNLFGFLILIIGLWNLMKKDRKLFTLIVFILSVFEIYFSLFHKYCSPTYYFNPLIGIVALIFGFGIDLLFKSKKQFLLIFIMFFVVSSSNYFIQLRDLSARPTYLQQARAFIEKHIPEFSNICLASDNNLPQLNMTRSSYYHLIETAPKIKTNKDYRPMDNDKNYDNIYRELRIQSLAKNPQYNLIRWDKQISSQDAAVSFLRKHKIKFIICNGPVMVGSKELQETKIVSLVKEFKPNNTRVYEDNNFYLYRVN